MSGMPVSLLLMMSLAGGGGNLAAAPAASAGPFAEGIELAASAQALGQDGINSSFNFLQLRDLWVRVNVSRMPKTAELNLVFISPSGEPFYESNVFFSRDTKVKSVKPAGADQPSAALQAKRLPGGFALDQPIPIAGSVFLRYPMPGTWLVQARISGMAETLTTIMQVEVMP